MNNTECIKIVSRFIKECGGFNSALNKISEEVYGELNEFTALGLNGYLVYGNRKLLVYVDDIEDPFTYVVDIYGDDKHLVLI